MIMIHFFCDDTFTSSCKRVFEFCSLIKETGIKFSWGCESRADIVTEDLIIALKEAGCIKRFWFGKW